MIYRLFYLPTLNPDDAVQALNQFLQSARVISVERQFVAAGANSFWSVCVCVASTTQVMPGKRQGARVDYRELLSPEDFAVYARLRTLRNQLAETEGTPAYAIFTNEQLANIARLPHADRASIGAIEGIGEKRLNRYVDAVLAVLRGADDPHQPH